MSIKVMSLVWEHAPVKGGDLLLLLAMADRADDPPAADSIFLSVNSLARRVRGSRATVHRSLARLKDMGLLEVQSERAGRPVHYRIAVELLTGETGVSNCDTSDHPGVSQSETGLSQSERGGVSTVRHNTSTKQSSNLGEAGAGPPPDGRAGAASRHGEHAEAVARLEASVHDHEWRGILGRLHVIKASDIAVKLSFRSRTEVEFVENNFREHVARAFDVPVSAVQIVKGGRPPEEKPEEGT